MKRSAIKLAKRGLGKLGLRIERASLPPVEQTVIFCRNILDRRRVAAGADFFFVQVGACDGVSFDDLYGYVTSHRLRGLVIEPLPDLFEELRKNYAAFPSVTPVNVALHRTANRAELYRVSSAAAGLPSWTKGIASLDPQHHRRSGTAAEHIVAETVPCMTWERLLAQYKIDRIDYLQIDTEGYDFEILQMIDFDKLRPAIIKFEHQVSAGVMSDEQFGQAAARLTHLGYLSIITETDVFAYLPL